MHPATCSHDLRCKPWDLPIQKPRKLEPGMVSKDDRLFEAPPKFSPSQVPGIWISLISLFSGRWEIPTTPCWALRYAYRKCTQLMIRTFSKRKQKKITKNGMHFVASLFISTALQDFFRQPTRNCLHLQSTPESQTRHTKFGIWNS